MANDRAQLLVASAGWYEGMVDFGGRKRKVQLFDNTVNGAFNIVAWAHPNATGCSSEETPQCSGSWGSTWNWTGPFFGSRWRAMALL
jgi:hypothetical protein